MTLPAPAAQPSAAQPSKEARPKGSLTMGAVLAVVLGVDWWLPLRGWPSYGLGVVISGLVLPWAVLTLRFVSATPEERYDPRQVRLARERRLHGMALRLGLILLTCALVVAKWSVLLAAEGSNQAYVGASRSYALGLGLLAALGLVARDLRASRFLATASMHPARLMALSFGGVGLVGTLLLSLPFAHRDMATVSLVDNLFMAMSAVCVTGLSSVSVAETYSFPGQIIVLLLVQAGGLGIMVLSAAIALMSGQRLRVSSSVMLTEVVDGASLSTLRRTVLGICSVTLLVEAVGAGLLYASWQGTPEPLTGHDVPPGFQLWWAALFHSVAAFCNAGMSIYRQGAVDFATQPLTLGVLALLVVCGGLGFPVLQELLRALWRTLRRRRREPFSLHARVVLRVSALLLAVQTIFTLLLEWRASLAPLGYVDRVFAGAFQAAVVRSAGFNAVDVGAMLPATLLLTCMAMFIGAGPGSTGGGIKVTTLAALFAGMKAELSASTPRLMNRTLPDTVVRKAVGVAFLSLCIVVAAFFLLLLLEPHPPLFLMFEAVSAFSTTGLSTGITSALTTPGKLLIAVLMFAGRIGPLTLALALSDKVASRAVKLPEERVLIG